MYSRCGDEDPPSSLQLVDSRELSIAPREVWGDEYDPDLYQRRNATEPAVCCPGCEAVVDVVLTPREDAEG
jgi:hypothetical protein